MRTSVAALGGIAVLFVGFFGLQEAASQSKDAAVTNGTNSTSAAWNTSTEVFNGLGQAFGPGIVWFGIAAVIIVALGFLVMAGNSGR